MKVYVRKGVESTGQDKQKQYARQNKYISENYERQTVVFKKGTKEALTKKSGTTVGKTINMLVDDYLGR